MIRRLLPASLFLLAAFPSFAALPVVINSGAPGSCPPSGSSYTKGGAIANTNFDSYYFNECNYAATTTIAVSDAAIVAGTTYTVYLHFAEIWYGAGNSAFGQGNGARIFHVDVEGTRILTNFDVHAAVGSRTALGVKYDVTALNNGSISITLTKVLQNPKISAIEVRVQGEASSLPPDNGFYDLNAAPFPVEWAELGARAVDSKALISWATATESNNAGFEVQMAGADADFQQIGFVEGAGSSESVRQYSFTTESLEAGTYYFRLLQVDFDGNSSVSPTVELRIGMDEQLARLSLAPNPAASATWLSVQVNESQPGRLSLKNIIGQTIFTFYEDELPAGVSRHPVDLSSLTPGVYVIHLELDGQSAFRRLVVTEE